MLVLAFPKVCAALRKLQEAPPRLCAAAPEAFAGQRSGMRGAGDKLTFTGKQQTTGLGQFRIDIARRVDVSRRRSHAAPWRCMIVHCWAMLSRLFQDQ